MKRKLILEKFRSFLKTNWKSSLAIALGCMLFVLSKLLIDSETKIIPPSSTWTKLAAILLISITLFINFARKKRLLFANISLVCVLFILFEGTCFFLLDMPDKLDKDFELLDLDPEHIAAHLGMVPFQDSVIRDLKIVDGDTIYDVDYSIGKDCERLTPNWNAQKSKYALFFGCSIGFGHGLEDNQTLAYQFQENSPCNSYNYAYSGYGTNHMLARLQYQNLRKIIPKKEKEGAGFYIFYWDHIERSIGSMARYTEWLHTSPYFEFQDGKLVRDKAFKDGRPFVSSFYEAVYQLSCVKYFDMTFPAKLSDQHFDLVSEMVLESKKTYKKQFENDNFYVVIYPTYEEIDPKLLKAFYASLKKKNIQVLNLNEDIHYDASYSIHAHEAHPSAFANETIAKLLVERMRKEQPALVEE